MSLNFIRAHFNCDECGTQFSVSMDPALKPPSAWSLFDCAVDAVRGTIDYEEHRNRDILGLSSVQDDKHLCAACTSKADAEDPDDDAEVSSDRKGAR
jgi:hypothetical protein